MGQGHRRHIQLLHLLVLGATLFIAGTVVAVNLAATKELPLDRSFAMPAASLPGGPTGILKSGQDLLLLPTVELVSEENIPVSARVDEPPAATPTPEATRRPKKVREPSPAGPGPTSTPPPTPTPELPPLEPTQISYAYTVREGDTLFDIAMRFGISVESILWNNIHVTHADELYIGQQLQIPAVDGVIYSVQLGDSLAGIAERHGATVDVIIDLDANGLASEEDLAENTMILIPGGTPPPPAELPDVVEIPSPTDTETPADTETPTEQPTPGDVIPPGPAYTTDRLRLRKGSGTQHEIITVMPLFAPVEVLDAPKHGFYPVHYAGLTGWASGDYLRAGQAPEPTPGPTSEYGFQWPLYGPINSYFGPGHPLGIDIGTNRQIGLPIVASLDGTVTFAGGNPCCSYGLYVIVKHGNGFETRYAHFSRIDVVVGQQVSRGQQLGGSGNTGYSTGPHLHFEIRQNGVPVNPLDYLP